MTTTKINPVLCLNSLVNNGCIIVSSIPKVLVNPSINEAILAIEEAGFDCSSIKAQMVISPEEVAELEISFPSNKTNDGIATIAKIADIDARKSYTQETQSGKLCYYVMTKDNRGYHTRHGIEYSILQLCLYAEGRTEIIAE